MVADTDVNSYACLTVCKCYQRYPRPDHLKSTRRKQGEQLLLVQVLVSGARTKSKGDYGVDMLLLLLLRLRYFIRSKLHKLPACTLA